MGINFSEVKFSYYIPRKKQNIRFALNNINLNIAETGELIALVGHTGSGKSTLVQLMNALLMPTSGKIEIMNETITHKSKLKPLRRKIGLVFQFPEYQIFETTVLKDIAFGPANFGIKNPEGKAKEIAKLMGIEELLERSPFTLSGGQLRKVAISGILASNPDILILDEPTVGLDPNAKRELLNILMNLHQCSNKTIVIITHDMEVVSRYFNRVIVLKEGEIIYDGSKYDLLMKDDLYETYNLNYPETIRILRAIKNRFNVNVDVNQHTIEDAYREIRKAFEIA
ncbi:MAG: ATP-binding cassette domain-containing protein [Bacilli bacterium]|nr:ATP-binding cassette domain-containing protein [Bacilli bacterium]